MDKVALKKAQIRLSVAKDAVAALPDTADFEAFSKQWFVFLAAAKNIYTMLEEGAKPSPQSRQWFGAKNNERKRDPLLRYVTEARNDDHHGLAEPAQRIPAVRAIGAPVPGGSRMFTDENRNLYIDSTPIIEVDGQRRGIFGGYTPKQLIPLDGKPIGAAYSPARIVLRPVKDREGKVYRPPLEHLGHKLKSTAPKDVAKLALDYLDGLLREAEGLHKP